MKPHLVKWHEQFESQGLVIIEIDNGAIDSLEAVQSWINDAKPPYPVVHDGDGAVCNAYGVTSYPSSYLVARNGQVVWSAPGWSNDTAEKVERTIERELAAR